MALDWKSTSQWWYGRFTEKGRSKLVNLGIKISGVRPGSISADGPSVDQRFIHSRGRAMQEHDRVRDEIRSRSNLQELTQKIVELKTGNRMESVALADLPDAWGRIPRRREPDDAYAQNSKHTLRRFATFVTGKWPDVADLASVTRDQVAAFMEAETSRGLAAKTWNDTLKLLRRTFRHFQPESDAFRRYLVTTPSREAETIYRQPFTPEELQALLDAAKGDEFTRPLIVTAMCTAMRRGDVCLLRWQDVDLDRGFITVKTAKTGQTVTIPIFPLLNDELRRRKRGGSEYVFPEAATMYQENPDGITWRVKKLIASALHPGGGNQERLPDLAAVETRAKGHAYIETLGGTPKAVRMKAVFDAYLNGVPGREVVSAHGISKGALSGYLNEIESKIGCRVIRGRHGQQGVAAMLRTDGDVLRAERKCGQRRASVRDFHSFRVTWVTLALTAGVPLELVRKVTGHKTVETVLTHYFQPGREDFRHALQSAMPRLLMNGAKSRDEHLREIIGRMTPKTWKQDKVRALAFLGGSG